MSEQSPEQNVDNLNKTPASVDGAATDKAFLNTLRQSIDAVDCEIQTLINNRAKLAQQVATVKKTTLPIVLMPKKPILFFIVLSVKRKC